MWPSRVQSRDPRRMFTAVMSDAMRSALLARTFLAPNPFPEPRHSSHPGVINRYIYLDMVKVLCPSMVLRVGNPNSKNKEERKGLESNHSNTMGLLLDFSGLRLVIACRANRLRIMICSILEVRNEMSLQLCCTVKGK